LIAGGGLESGYDAPVNEIDVSTVGDDEQNITDPDARAGCLYQQMQPKSRVTATWRKLTNHWTYINPP
jgi:hypothetical protein